MIAISLSKNDSRKHIAILSLTKNLQTVESSRTIKTSSFLLVITNNNIKEARCLQRCAKAGINVPTLYLVDLPKGLIYMEFIDGLSVKEYFKERYIANQEGYTDEEFELSKSIGKSLGLLHNLDIIHGDLTSSNMIVRKGTKDVTLIDFGLSYVSNLLEDKAVDLYVLERALLSTHANSEQLFEHIMKGYQEVARDSGKIVKKLAEVRKRGRKRDMTG
ncbi:TP53 regulating kinase [Blyttiomyces sp. JEL0837]|nr:TP53 regulating kinase [Blyttiomyces sp. JEL0837]